MKRATVIFALIVSIECVQSQTPPPLYIHFVSHNEPNDHYEVGANYNVAKNNMIIMANLIDTYNLRWNIQTSDGLVLGALDDQAATSSNVFFTLANTPYNDNIEIDPRSKNSDGRNVADQWYLLDSLGANPSYNLGGCIYTTTDPVNHPIDWVQYKTPIIGNIYGNSWQCNILSGAGSYPPHDNDLKDFGIFMPSVGAFYTHDYSSALWQVGTGCAPVLRDTTNEQEIIDLIQGQIDSIQNGLWPANKFYVTRIMTNQKDYNTAFFTKLQNIIDSLSIIPSTKLKWATISETFTDFQAWQLSSGFDYSQWSCGQTILGTEFDALTNNIRVTIFPNPTDNKINIQVNENYSISDTRIKLFNSQGQLIEDKKNDLTTIKLPVSGIYFIEITIGNERWYQKVIRQ